MKQHLADIALYGLALFLVGVGWQFISAIIEVRKFKKAASKIISLIECDMTERGLTEAEKNLVAKEFAGRIDGAASPAPQEKPNPQTEEGEGK